MEFSPDLQMQTIADLACEFFEHVLFDEEPLFVSDDATIFDVSMSGPEELMKRLRILWNVGFVERSAGTLVEVDS